MKITTRIFGEIEISDDKIITFENGIIGFPDMKHFTLLHDEEKGTNVGIRFLQSIEEPSFAMPVMDPLVVMADYNPEVDDQLLLSVGELSQDNILVLVTATIPSNIEDISVNLQGPIVINVEERRACQIIVEGERYAIKYPIYDILQAGREGE